jgi:HPt (histidine-containing phosphotransfer) domain-containing protein
MIDWDRIRELRADIGADAFEEVLDLFLEEVETGLSDLDDSMSGAQRRERLHFIAGSALNLGFPSLASLCQSAEREQKPVTSEEIRTCYAMCRENLLANIGPQITA